MRVGLKGLESQGLIEKVKFSDKPIYSERISRL